MPATTTLVQNLIWYTNSPILFLCAFFLYRRGYVRYFPYFFIYLVFVGIKSYLLIPVSKYWGFSSYQYFYGTWGTTLIVIGLSFVVLYEVVRNVLTSGTLKISRANFILMTAFLLLGGALVSITFEVRGDVTLTTAIFAVRNTVRFEQISLLLLLAILTLFFGFYWGDLAFGIAAGFGVYATMEIVSTYVRSHLGPPGTHLANLVNTWSYEVASLIWLAYALKKRKSLSISLPSDKVSEWSEPIERMIQ